MTYDHRTSLVLLTTALLGLTPTATRSADTGLTAEIQVRGRYYRAGEPVSVRIQVENPTEESIQNGKGLSLLASLRLDRGGKGTAMPVAVPPLDPASQPRLLLPGSGFLMVIDAAKYFPDLATPGTYTMRLETDQVAASPVELFVAHAFDPSLDYSATFKTDFGEITFDLLEDVAPDHVRNFVDLARSGFYDGTLFHQIAKGEVVTGGDKAGDGTGGVPYFLPPELTTMPHERGTLCSVRKGGPDNGAQFFIDLRRKEEFDGNFTIFGKMTEGDATLTALENVATSGSNYQPFFKPVQDVHLRAVLINERPGKEAQGDPGQGN